MNKDKTSSKKKWIIIGVSLLIVIAGILIWRKTQQEVITYRDIPVKKGNLEVTILSTGAVSPENRLDIKAPVAGRMDSVLVEEGQKLRKGQIIAWMSSTERAAMLDAARAKGADEYKRWSELYLATPVMAPIAGTLILRSVEPGQTFATTDAIFTMSDRLTVKAQVDETDISQIKLKMGAQIVLDAYPGQKIKAQADQIAFDAKTVNSVTTYIVDVLPEKTPEFMRSGMTANVTFFVEARENILLVPNEALKVQDGKTLVMLKAEDGSRQLSEIQIGLSDGKFSEVIDGLDDGDVVSVKQVVLGKGGNNGTNPFGMPKAPGRKAGGH